MTVAAYGMVICGTDNVHRRYRGRIEKVKFGIPINEAFSHDIPATLLVLLLKVNKEGPLKKDIWRAPGNQIQVRKLSAIMQQGRLVNISNISVYTAASVLKKFLSKLPGGIFGADNEKQLFSIVQQQQQLSDEEQRKIFCRVICSLSQPSQHLLVLLFGTFRVISDSAETFGTRMNADAIGISVAPSLFHTCIHDQRAKLEDVMRFKMASQVITKIIQGFGYTNLFPRECYEFYARITGRTLRVDEQWNFTFQFPSRTCSQPSIPAASESPRPSTSRGAGVSGKRRLATGVARERSAHDDDDEVDDGEVDELCEVIEDEDVYGESLPELGHHGHYVVTAYGGVRHRVRMHSLEDTPALFGAQRQRLSTSMGAVSGSDETPASSSARFRRSARGSVDTSTFENVGGVSQRLSRRYPVESLESTRSLTYLEWVHEEQTKRMISRSEWFLETKPRAQTLKSNASSRWDIAPISKADDSSKFTELPIIGKLSSPMHLTIPKQDEDLLMSSGDEEMSSAFLASSSSSMKCSPRPISSVSSGVGGSSSGGVAAAIERDNSGGLLLPSTSRADNKSKMSVDVKSSAAASQSEDEEELPFNVKKDKPTRQPLKLLQSSEYAQLIVSPTPHDMAPTTAESTPSAVADSRTPAATSSSKSSTIFQYQIEPELRTASAMPLTSSSNGQENDSILPISPPSSGVTSNNTAATIVTQVLGSATLSNSSSGSGGSVATAVQVSTTTTISLPQLQQRQQPLQRRVSSSGVVRRRSWRTHYTRPNKSLEYDSGQTKVRISETSHSSPAGYSKTNSVSASRQASSEYENENNQKATVASITTTTASQHTAIIRQASSSAALPSPKENDGATSRAQPKDNAGV